MTSQKTQSRTKSGETLRQLIQPVLDKGYSISIWKKPLETSVHLILAEKSKLITISLLEDFGPGFLFSPFNKNDQRIFLPADHYYVLKAGELESEHPAGFINLEEPNNNTLAFHLNQSSYQSDSGYAEQEQHYRMLISDCVHHIHSGRFEKIVPSRKKQVELSKNTNPLDLFETLCEEYPHAMVSLVSTPYSGTWIGATPEPLISVDQNGIFKTVALAGTQRFDPNISESQVSWKQKEIEEQAFVQRYIINCFKKIRLREFTETGPRTVRAGNLLHLRTDFTVNLHEVRYPDLASVMLELLHPTSAVCGMPLEPALNYLIRQEGYQREFYSGYLGPVNLEEETHLFVNLRCMKWEGSHAWVFAGAGVTADSNPESEFTETELKMQTLLRLIGRS